MVPSISRFRHARLYITFRCNARCGYCNVWQDPVFDGHQELTADGLRRCLDQLAELGVTYLDITGGEPALHRELTAAVRHAHELGMSVDITTNAIRFPPAAREIVPLLGTINVSLDTLDAERYHGIRGTDTLDRTLGLVRDLGAAGATNLKLICVVSGQNAEELPEIVRYAQRARVPVYLSPMFSYFAAQRELRPAGSVRMLKLAAVNGRANPTAEPAPPPLLSLPTSELARHVAELRYEPYTVVSLAFLHHLRTLDPATETNCGANSRILTVGPDGRVLLPCYHEWDASLPWDRPYRELVEDPELIRVRDEEVGRRPGCRSCAVFPYLGLAMSYRLTAPFLVQAFSEELLRLKRHAGPLTGDRRRALLRRGDALLAAIERHAAPLRGGSHPDELYHFEATGDGRVRTDLSADPVTVEELLADHAHEDCWRAQRTPHRLVRLLYADIQPAPLSAELADELPEVQLDCWEILLGLLPEATAGPGAGLAGWCDRAGRALRGHQAAASVALLATFSDLPAEAIAAWGGVAGHPEEALAVKLLRTLATAERRRELAPLFSAELAPALLGPRRAVADPVPAGPPPTPEAARRGEDLPRFTASLRHADTATLRIAIRRWKAAADPTTAQAVERRLLLSELTGTPR
ncbi:radical SAM protein [Streptomyces sp. 8K308]|uniref:radical SAM protein n=1 Tax=Streptomyces sp. 8K308 TaxID=2530388 RepID=UPI00104F38DB|nr:radical SAM protein [Streptomyces sp. 8K308]TDC25221.1 radical SAM protein [Streptomyces sp. 8K308]